jgi:hypothetical protein
MRPKVRRNSAVRDAEPNAHRLLWRDSLHARRRSLTPVWERLVKIIALVPIVECD